MRVGAVGDAGRAEVAVQRRCGERARDSGGAVGAAPARFAAAARSAAGRTLPVVVVFCRVATSSENRARLDVRERRATLRAVVDCRCVGLALHSIHVQNTASPLLSVLVA